MGHSPGFGEELEPFVCFVSYRTVLYEKSGQLENTAVFWSQILRKRDLRHFSRAHYFILRGPPWRSEGSPHL
jgi:hypothetical protein